jgi:cyclopropane fatty-acyl-phospholipid synthase-like methyltransferase
MRALEGTPFIGAFALRVAASLRRKFFSGSRAYWEGRYAAGGNSGAGSFGELARFKAEVLNDLIETHHIRSVVEFGCGDGSQLSLAKYPEYVGLDVAPSAIQLCKSRFADDATKSFFLYDPAYFVDGRGTFRRELAISLDVIYHLVEDPVFETYMQNLFGAATKLVVIYSSDTEENRHYGAHVRNRRFTDWVREHAAGWELALRIPNRFPFKGDVASGSISDFFVYRRI